MMARDDETRIEEGPSPERSPEEIRAYWTPERMASAEPVEAPSPTSHADRGTAPPAPTGEPGGIPGAPPARQADNGDEGNASPVIAPAYSVTSRVDDPHVHVYPYCATGKLFFTRDNRDKAASASVVATNGIMTAGHVLYNPTTRSWADDILFCPGYDSKMQSLYFGSWVFARRFAYPRWVQYGDRAYDFALCELRAQGGNNNQSVAWAVGRYGLHVNAAIVQWMALGYPDVPYRQYNFNGLDMWACTGDKAANINGQVIKDGVLTEGSSGGPWLIATDLSWANGLQSTFNTNTDDSGSPYFAQWVLDFYRQSFPNG
jgi:V8-like Glu-specific endopeptidase